MQIFNELECSVNKLGKIFLFGRKTAFTQAKEILEKASLSYASLKESIESITSEKLLAERNIEKLEDTLKLSQEENCAMKQTITENEIKIKSLKESMESITSEKLLVEEENCTMKQTITENEIKIKNFGLVSDALRAKPIENSFILRFKDIIHKDFVAFCDKEPYLNDTIPLRELEGVLKEMRLIANCPELHRKSLGAVGGGFSSGKSSFLNSFLTGSKVHLAEGIRPVTAIPSYVLCSDDSKINGISYKGGCFDISLEMYKSISHEFLESFTFDLKEIILYTIVLAPMQKDYFENLCLIDTPGYNPPSSGTAEKDFEIAREYIKDAQFLIWMVGLDSNGTIPKSDLDFLEKLEFGKTKDRELYIIANKAETKNPDDLEDILDVFEECLDDHDFEYTGITAYSSKTQKAYTSRKTNIYDFLVAHNKPSSRYAPLKNTLNDVFSGYITMITQDFNNKEAKRKEVKKLLLHALEGGNIAIDESSNVEEGLKKLIQYFTSDESLETRLNRAKKLRESFIECFDSFCDQIGIERVENVFCTNTYEKAKADTGKRQVKKKATKHKPLDLEKLSPRQYFREVAKRCEYTDKTAKELKTFLDKKGLDTSLFSKAETTLKAMCAAYAEYEKLKTEGNLLGELPKDFDIMKSKADVLYDSFDKAVEKTREKEEKRKEDEKKPDEFWPNIREILKQSQVSAYY